MFLFSRSGPYLDEVDPSIALESAGGEGRLAQWRALRKFVVRTRPQIVVSFLSYFSVLTAVHAAAVGARVVFNQQTPMSAFLADGDYPWRRGWRRMVFNLATRTANLTKRLSALAAPASYATAKRKLTLALLAGAKDLLAIAKAAQAHDANAARTSTKRLVVDSAKIRSTRVVLAGKLGLP